MTEKRRWNFNMIVTVNRDDSLGPKTPARMARRFSEAFAIDIRCPTRNIFSTYYSA